MSPRVGSVYSEKSAIPKRVGIVVEVYQFEGQTRCVVRSGEGPSRSFFEFELVAAEKGPDQAGC